jgi:hypothetical protein
VGPERLSTIKSTLPDQVAEAEVEEIRQETALKQVITPDGVEKTTESAPTAMDLSMAQMLAGKSLSAAAEGICRWMEKEAKNSSKDWPKFNGKVLSYMAWKKAWIPHHKEVYPRLTVEHLNRVLFKRCLPDNIKEKIQFKRNIEEVWKFLDITFLKPDTFFHELMQPMPR